MRERYNMFASGKRDPQKTIENFDDSKESWCYLGWTLHQNSITGGKRYFREIFNSLPKDGSIPFSTFSNLSRAHAAIYDEPLDLSELVSAYLEPYKPMRVVLSEDADGQLCGLVENSFSIDWKPSHAKIFWSGKAYSIIGEHQLDGIKDAKYNAKTKGWVMDPFDPLCPIEVDWVSWLTAESKWAKRNAPFTERIFEQEEEDAVLK